MPVCKALYSIWYEACIGSISVIGVLSCQRIAEAPGMLVAPSEASAGAATGTALGKVMLLSVGANDCITEYIHAQWSKSPEACICNAVKESYRCHS